MTITDTNRTELEECRREIDELHGELATLAYALSHEMRSPVRVIDAFAEALAEDYAAQLDAEGQEHLQRIRDAAGQMDRYIRGIVALATVAKAELTRRPLDISGMSAAIIGDLAATEPQRTVNVSIEPGITIEGDTTLMNTALSHLLGNAWKFTSRSAAASIAIGTASRDGRRCFVIRDNGAGFDPAYARTMFGPFQRFHKAGEFPGDGIGLAIVRRIVRRHGGNVFAEGRVGEGATFFVAMG